jgi:hypothetical protein
METLVDLDRRLTSFARLEANWDGYDGKPISSLAITAVRRFIEAVKPEYTELVPCSDGGVQIEWHVNGVDVEIIFGPDGEQE